ncbi:GFA family protein [Caulobacter hibisci]|uniref:GFA family protein n=1 Tax=Caulobacter hibisci TaxID=2035993 RepID=A0ABS0SZ59_9CAUL|nr:GFA family protein [Caulobacter hibisci]MBI1684150.1 GFA family protein [Caulobacter hibisci]
MRIAQCRCGAVSVQCAKEPVGVSVCHCLACQQRTGSVLAAQARFEEGSILISGQTNSYIRAADSGARVLYLFCPRCADTIAYVNEREPDLVAIPLGAFADPHFPAPTVSSYEHRAHSWVLVAGLGETIAPEGLKDDVAGT